MQYFFDGACMSTSLEDCQCDALVEFDLGYRLLCRQDLVFVEGEVSILHLLTKLALDAEVFLVGGQGVRTVDLGATVGLRSAEGR